MNTYLRFTDEFEADTERGHSFLNTATVKNQKLNGICAFTFDIDEMTEEQIIAKIKMYKRNYSYLSASQAVVFEGNYVGSNPNGEGVLVEIISEINTYEL